ncbi:DUF305 domain-containing protein [Cellulosimicrobium cellulans]|uniref:DUF305 domain-containing protein n=1 Tax=Cellulosimicrobium cellulans TaxID=1710 RepID=UPI0020978625|nr:DUF305 domain-containing protein [Cellulosimicrobium cellulans]MCO7275506.1 DUF305 domain-containing protein [Cellulosimicrobium cellulans]
MTRTARTTLAALALGTTLALTGCSDAGTGDAGEQPAGTPTSTAPASATTASAADVMFAQMMIPHHEQAVEMSAIVLAKDGVDERVVALAEQIEAAQAPEIEQMTAMLDRWGADPSGGDHAGHMGGMLDDDALAALEAAPAEEAQRLFLEGMVEHHEGAVAMAQDVLAEGEDPEVLALAEEIVAAQQEEIDAMRSLLAEL